VAGGCAGWRVPGGRDHTHGSVENGVSPAYDSAPTLSSDERLAIPSQTFDSIAVIGLGAIGGSLAWGARRHGVTRVLGYTPDRQDAEAAQRAGAVSELASTVDGALRDVELVVLAAPPRPTLDLIRSLAPRLPAGAVLSDVASVKSRVLTQAIAAGLEARFAGAHPLAGTHESGFGGATPELLRSCLVYVCATGERGRDAACRVADFWASVFAATPVFIDPAEHDRLLAWTSHLPQAVAYALANALAARRLPGRALGPGARDTTRLAASSPSLWVDIFLDNRDEILSALDAARGDLNALRDLIDRRDEAGLSALLSSAATFRRELER
jgi:prephenate dehydrogenase